MDLPQPLGPIKAVVRPAAMVRSSWCSTTVPPYDLEMSISSIIQPIPSAAVPTSVNYRPMPCATVKPLFAASSILAKNPQKMAITAQSLLILTLREVVRFVRGGRSRSGSRRKTT